MMCPYSAIIYTYQRTMELQPTTDMDSTPTKPSLDADLLLAQTAACGDGAARRRLAEAVYDSVRRTMRFLSNCDHEVDDLTQNALVEILQSIGGYRGDAPLAAWADRIAVRTAARQFEKRSRRLRLFEKAEPDLAPSSPVLPEEVTADRQVYFRFQEIVAELSSENRLALVLHHIKGYSITDIATMCACSKFTIKGRLRRSRRRLRLAVLNDPVLSEWIEDATGQSVT